ncbi:MAG: hypothetical protein ACTSRP_02520 [Candidatus Helarchaeota archaeon]
MDLDEELKKFEGLYKRLMTEDNTPDDEAQAKMDLLEMISNIEAALGDIEGALKDQLEKVKEDLLSWDPYGPWFKEQRDLVKGIYNLITNIKKYKYSGKTIPSGGAQKLPDIENLKKEITEIKNTFTQKINKITDDIKNIKKSITIIVKSLQSGKTLDKTSSEELEKSSVSRIKTPATRPTTSTHVPEPIPIPSPIESAPSAPKPIEIKQPSKFKTIQIPTPPTSSIPTLPSTEAAPTPRMPSPQRSKPTPVQIPVALEGVNEQPMEVEINSQNLETSTEAVDIVSPDLSNILSDKKEQTVESRTDKDTLFSIFSGKEIETEIVSVDEPHEPTPEPVSNSSLFKVLTAPEDQLIKPNSTQVEIFLDEDNSEPEVVELTVEEEAPTEVSSTAQSSPQSAAPSSTEEDVAPETLYQELINLEGKRYSLERSIRDLKRDREAGKISDNEYKSKLSKLAKELKEISNRIEDIREKLD